MKTAETLQRKLADGTNLKANNGRVSFEAGQSTWTLTADSESLDGIGGRFRNLRLDRTAGTPNTPLNIRAATIAGRLTGMLESIRLVEVDQGRQVAQLRSSQPTVRGTTRQYYELLMEGGDSITLERFQSDAGTNKREQIPFTLTYDALDKLLHDLTDE
ncbi:hypothetical protein [Zavarzinella formosa]|uniref:hypothetical protein n=1 Tax=Zavarzinella formosa TaxID=360055 RepID=UPI0002DCC525|nr:hypothetical protein [Zavarzinella formosa]